jgi:polar amino acid transport system substrate-binding protein
MAWLTKRQVLQPAAIFGLILLHLLAPGALADSSRTLKDIRDSGRLIVGVDIPYGVMEFYGKDGKPAGIDIDIAKAIAAGIGVTAQYQAMPFDNLFGALNDNKVDVVVSAVTITRERQKTLLFSAPYLSASTVIAVAKTNKAVNSIADIKNGKLGVLKGTLGETLANKSELLNGMTVNAYTDNDRRIEDLVSGKIDAAVVHFLVKTNLPIKIIGQPLRQNFYGIVAGKQSEALMSEVDKTLRAMKRDGRLMAIKKRYIK